MIILFQSSIVLLIGGSALSIIFFVLSRKENQIFKL